MKKYLWLAGLFNFVFGALSFLVLALWIMSYIYIAEAIGWIVDPTLDEGLLILFLFLSIIISVIYFPILIFTNIGLWKKINMKKLHYVLFTCCILILGLSSFCYLLYFLR